MVLDSWLHSVSRCYSNRRTTPELQYTEFVLAQFAKQYLTATVSDLQYLESGYTVTPSIVSAPLPKLQ
jgi:hypothetical protein